MNILISCCAALEAAPAMALGLAKGLADNGVGVWALLSSRVSNKKAWEADPRITCVYIDTILDSKERLSKEIKFSLVERGRVRKAFKGICFDFVIHPMPHRWEKRINRLVNKDKTLVTVHDPVHHSGTSKRIERMQNAFVEMADGVIVLTESFVDSVSSIYGINADRVIYIPLGNLTPEEQDGVKSPVSYRPDAYNFLFFGRICEYKGLDVLSKAYAKLAVEYADISLTVVGNGDFSRYQNEYAALPNCTIVNRYIEDAEIPKLFDGENLILLLPYLDATQSGVIPTALSRGVPIIASNAGGLSEQLAGGKYGALVSSGVVDGLYEAMRRVVSDPSYYASLKECSARGGSVHSWSAIGRQLLGKLREFNIRK